MCGLTNHHKAPQSTTKHHRAAQGKVYYTTRESFRYSQLQDNIPGSYRDVQWGWGGDWGDDVIKYRIKVIIDPPGK